MSIHIAAEPGQIASTVLLPGDPLRAEHFAKTLLDDPVCFNHVRGMLGYTGTYQGQRVSIMGSGMGIPSLSIYVHELINSYDVDTLIRVGTCGAFQPKLKVGDLVLAMSSSTNSYVNHLRFKGMDYAPTADFGLLLAAYEAARSRDIDATVGGILSSDSFYTDDPDEWKLWAAYGVLVVEMETTGLYTLAAKFGARALSILTVSDSLVSGKGSSSEEREKSYTLMAEIALEAASGRV